MRDHRNPIDGGGLTTGQIVGLGVVVALALLAAPLSAGATTSVQKVLLVGPLGTPLKTLGGSLDVGDGKGAMTVNGTINSVIQPPGPPVHYQGFDLQPSTVHGVLHGLPRGTAVSITSVTAVCSPSPGGSGCNLNVFDSNQSDCSANVHNPGDIVQMSVVPSNPSIEFTFPIPRAAPVGFAPSGPWCLGVSIGGTGTMSVTIDGYTTT